MFIVRVRKEGNPGLGEELRKFRSYRQAKSYAEKRAWDFPMGTVIHDTVRNLIDFGDDTWTDADDCRIYVEEPYYARRLRESRPSFGK